MPLCRCRGRNGGVRGSSNGQLGRLTTRDVLFGEPTSPVSLNQFTYGNLNPISMVDPTGMRPYCDCEDDKELTGTWSDNQNEYGPGSEGYGWYTPPPPTPAPAPTPLPKPGPIVLIQFMLQDKEGGGGPAVAGEGPIEGGEGGESTGESGGEVPVGTPIGGGTTFTSGDGTTFFVTLERLGHHLENHPEVRATTEDLEAAINGGLTYYSEATKNLPDSIVFRTPSFSGENGLTSS